MVKKALDLFSGSGSWNNVLKRTHDVVTVDITDYGKYNITHKVDILEWDYKMYPEGYFDIISAGCPCVWYCNMQKWWIGKQKRNKQTKELYTYTQELYNDDLRYSDRLVKKTIEIIDYFKPRLWFIENPATSILRKRNFMKGRPYYVVDYCSYGFPYKKRTIIWTNKKEFDAKRCNGNCEFMVGNKHMVNVGKDKHGLERYKVPPQLIKELIK